VTEKIVDLPTTALKPSPFNPRKHLGDVAELAASIGQVGVLEPVVVRTVGKGYELVFGHRRHAAAVLAKLKLIPGIVREYSDDDVLEVQIVENSQRADVHPLDEADGFKVLVDRGRTVAQIADKVGRSRAYVAQRPQLCHLSEHGRQALDQEEISLGAAQALARVPERLQQEALEALVDSTFGDDQHAPISSAHARSLIESEFMLRLEQAPWRADEQIDAELVPKAGPCSACPKRTGNQAELFDDVKSPDLCTDPTCFRAKLDALWKLRKKDKGENAPKLLEGAEAKKALSYSGGYEKLDAKHWTGSKHVEVAKVVKKAGAPITIAQDPETGAHVELVRKADLDKALKVAAPEAKPARDGYAAADRRRELEDKKRRRVVALAAAEQASRGEAESLIAMIVRAFAARAWNDHQKAVLARRGVAADKRKHGSGNDVEGALLKHIDGLDLKQVLGLGVELALLTAAPSMNYGGGTRWKPALMALGVDEAKIEKQVAAEFAERARAKRAKASKKAKAKPARAVPA
jgi:ParB/RepB/Spo0J family partition protein